MLGSGNLGLIYLMEERRRLTLEEIDERHPSSSPPSARTRMSAGFSSARPSTARSRSAQTARTTSPRAAWRARTRSPTSRRTRPKHLLRTDGFEHVGDIMVGSFYDPDLDEGCAFEELISFHGGMGGLQTRPFILHPAHLEVPAGPILGAASVHGILAGWRAAGPERAGEAPPQTGPATAEPVGSPGSEPGPVTRLRR